MKSTRTLLSLLLVGILWFCAAGMARASLTLSSGLGTTHAGNLVTNGSFEVGAPLDGTGNWVMWADPPQPLPPGWLGSGVNSVAAWGNDGPSPYRLKFSDDLPDGRVGIDFHTGTGTTVNVPPTVHPNGIVTFPSAPTFTFAVPLSTPVTLTQASIPTNAVPQPSYSLSFWVSGEENTTNQGNIGLGLIGMQLTNVLPSDPITWLVVPNGLVAPFGLSHLYEFKFTPINPLNPVDLSFISPGGLNLSAWGGTAFGVQPVLDDVIINGVPEPASIALLAVGVAGVLAVGRRRRKVA